MSHILCIGDIPQRVGEHIETVRSELTTTKTLGLSASSTDPAQSGIIYVDSINQGIKLLTSNDCSQRSEYQPYLEYIDRHLRKVFEASGGPSSLHAISSLGDSGLSRLLIEDLSDCYPDTPITSTLLDYQPNLPGGLRCFEVTQQLFTSLGLCEAVLIRRAVDTCILLEKSGSGSFSSADVDRVIACDLALLMTDCTGSESGDLLGPLWWGHVCSARSRLLDLRSSLWQFLYHKSRQKRKGSTRPLRSNSNDFLVSPTSDCSEFHSTRAMYANLATLHQATFSDHSLTTNEYWTRRAEKPWYVSAANVYMQGDVLRANSWSDGVRVTGREHKESRKSVLLQSLRTACSSGGVPAPLWQLSHTGAVPFSEDSGHRPSSTEQRSSFDAVAFASPYASIYAAEVVERSRVLVRTGAYDCSLSQQGQEMDELKDCIAGLEMYLY